MEMTLPNFIVIGAGRAGTTSTYHYLRQHPDVFMSPIKETNFFAYRAMGERELAGEPDEATSYPVRTLDEYRRLFEGAGSAAAIGEASPRYLADPRVIEGIVATLPEVRLLAIVRDPVERAYSSFLFHTRDGRETRTFATAIEQELERRQPGGLRFGQRHYVALGFYDRLLAPFYERFGARRIGVFLYDDLTRDPVAFMGDMFGFLGVDPAFLPDTSVRYNAGGAVRGRVSRFLFAKRPWKIRLRRALPGRLHDGAQRWIERVRAPRLEVPPLPDETRARLAALYAEDIARLEARIGRDLGGWLAAAGPQPEA
jgi:hypothetical protein